MVTFNRLEGYAQITGVAKDLSVLGVEAISGTLALERGTVIVARWSSKTFTTRAGDPAWTRLHLPT